jgi:glucose-1-phosphatase
MNIKNIIFDLGAVLFNLDFGRTEAAFAALLGQKAGQKQLYQQLIQEKFLEKFETGHVTEEEFIQKMQKLNPNPVNAAQICTAWSAMLLDLPKERLDLLEKIKSRGYNLFLLSNINVVHLRDFYETIAQTHQMKPADFDGIFKQVFYSHLIQHRKPAVFTYEFVLQQANILASETVFIDDNADNIKGAQQAGLFTYLHPANGDLRKTLEFLTIL